MLCLIGYMTGDMYSSVGLFFHQFKKEWAIVKERSRGKSLWIVESIVLLFITQAWNNLCTRILPVTNVENYLQMKKFKLTLFIAVIIFSLMKPSEAYTYFRSCNLRSDLALNWQRGYIYVKADNLLSKDFSHFQKPVLRALPC